MKNKFFFVIGLIFLLPLTSNSQNDYPLIPDHPGTFKLIDWGVYTHYDCGFTKAETTANYQKIIRITDLVRKNPLFIDQKGFECETYVYAKTCPDKFNYGIQSELSFGFGDWFLSDAGKPVFQHIEPPSWKLHVNYLNQIFGRSFNYGAPKPTEPPKEGFNYEKWKSVSDKMSECLCIKGHKEELGNGIDRYDHEVIVLYNPERPPYYLPVKFRELAEWLIEYWKLHPEKYYSDLMVGMIETEYANIPESERDGWAYYNTNDDRCPILTITPIPGPQPVVRLNPEYWNKKLPRSAIQVLTFDRLENTQIYTRKIEEGTNTKSNGNYVTRFLEVLDITTLVPAIDK